MDKKASTTDRPTADRPDRPAVTAFDVVRVLLGVLILLVAVLKGQELSSRPTADTGLLDHRLFLLGQVLLGVVVGFWLLSGLWRRSCWAVTLVTLSGLLLATVSEDLGAIRACNCFTFARPGNWAALALLIVPLAIFRPRLRARHPVGRPLRRALLAGVPALVLAGLLASHVMAYRPARLTADGQIVGQDRFVVLEPSTWVGHPFPLRRFIDSPVDLSRGSRLVVLYHWDCPACAEAIPKYDRDARLQQAVPGAPEMVLVEMPPYAPKGKGPLPAQPGAPLARLKPDHDWFVVTPVEIHLDDGVVVSATAGATRHISENLGKLAGGTDADFKDAPNIPLEGERYDFGFVKPGSTHRRVFVVDNPTDAPVGLLSVTSECKCMIVVNPPRLIPPGKTARIQMTFVAPKEAMHYSKRILIPTRCSSPDWSRKRIVLRVEANVGMTLTVTPAVTELGPTLPGEIRRFETTVNNFGADLIRLVYSTSKHPSTLAEAPAAPLAAKGSVRVPVWMPVEPGDPAAGRRELWIHTDHAKQPRLSVAARYGRDDRYRVIVPRIDLGRIVPGRAARGSVEIQAASADRPPDYVGVDPHMPEGVEVAVEPMVEGKRLVLTFTVTASGADRVVDGYVNVRLKQLERPLAVPVRGFVAGED